MIPFVAALLLAAVQTPADEARMQRIGPHVSACIRGQAAQGELIEACAERLAARAEVVAARRAEEEAEALRLWGEPCDPLDEVTGHCPAEKRMASHARACIDRRPDDQTLQDCVAGREAAGERYDHWAESVQARRQAEAARAEPEPDPDPAADRNGCRRERVISPDGQSVSYSFACNRSWTR
ncbi:MAG: hypothetical protein KF910_08315 [Brevundimonas sp.]|uniref:hypothetical protein n=1 Tax=Brevundimonas sp. TaxID=1871086 RepID=UPI0025BB8620|nr:hypothetical protein [Brevundimonas sp.]MBX3477598.1 hypothetical protein [Brevundimonas sp.]